MSHTHKQIRAIKIPILFLTFILLHACATYQKPLPEIIDAETKSLIDNIQSKDRSPDWMQAMADVDISASGRRYSLRLALVLKKPQSLRLESIPFIGTPDFFLSLNENDMKAFLPREGTFYIGKPTAKNFETFFPLKLPVEGLTALLMGSMPDSGKETQLYMGLREKDLVRIDVWEGSSKIRSVWADSVNRRIVKIVQFDAYENPLYTFSYGNFSKVMAAVPQTIQIALEQHLAQITIRYTDIQYLTGESDKIFDLAVPPGVRPTYLD